jgi:hypothetical protein
LEGKPDERELLGDLRIILMMDLIKIEWGGMNRIHLSQDRDQWRALVNTVMNHRVP